MKHLDPNDPLFTAKALGEEETQDINPEANEEFASLQSFADTLKTELKAEDEQDALTEEQKARVRTAIEPKRNMILRFPMWINAVAACLVLGLVGVFSFKMLDKSKNAFLSEVPLSIPMDENQKPTIEFSSQDKITGRALPEFQDERFIDDKAEISDFFEPVIEIPELEPASTIGKSKLQLDGELSLRADYEKGNSTAETNDTTTWGVVGKYPSSILNPPPPVQLRSIDGDDDSALNQPSMAGRRIRSSIRDAGASIKVVTTEFMEDVGATDGDSLGSFASASMVEGTQGNFLTPAPESKINSFDAYTKRKDFRQQQEPWNREAYDRIVENTFKNPTDHPLSTFSIDVDTASYANTRRFLNNGQLPPADAVRIEEMVNYFSYDYDEPKDGTPFAVHVDSANAPWNENHRLVRIGLQGDTIDPSERPDANLVFLIDVSGSMSNQNKLPLVQRSLNLLVDQMEARDRIAVVVYAGASGLSLPSTTANNKETIQHAISNLKSGGSTNGGAGIELAYSVAQKHFVNDGINRVILCTDGDFNVGTSDRGGLTRLIEEKAKTGVFFSVLGFGMGNYQDASMEELSNKGNGNYGYVDSFREARKVFVDDMLGTLYTIAKDVKIQVEFNPDHVGSYRLIGYENRMLAKEDFNDDTVDAGEIGAGHRVTALYEIVPVGLAEGKTPSVDALKYQTGFKSAVKSAELLTVKLRYKQPDEEVSQLIEQPFIDSGATMDAATDDFRFATAVASFGMLLRQSKLVADLSLNDVLSLATKAKGNDSGGLRSEFIELVEKTISLISKQEESPANSESKE